MVMMNLLAGMLYKLSTVCIVASRMYGLCIVIIKLANSPTGYPENSPAIPNTSKTTNESLLATLVQSVHGK